MRRVGLTDYETFAKAVLKEVKSKPISFEVFSDDFSDMGGKRSRSTHGSTMFTLNSQSQIRVANPLFHRLGNWPVKA
jgi:hypothetical protein